MIALRLDKLKAGMVTAEAVRTFQGMLLLKKGAALTAKNIFVMKSWGIREVRVQGEHIPDGGQSAAVADAYSSAVDRRLREKFSAVLDDPVMATIMEAARKRLLLKQPTGESND